MSDRADSDRPAPDLTILLRAAREGRDGAEAQLYGDVQDELQKLARLAFRREGPGHTLQPTALVNEAWIRLAHAPTSFEDRAHFFGIAARVMRQVLVDHARRTQADKRGGGASPGTLTEVAQGEPPLDVLELEEALVALEKHNARLAEIVQLRFFSGLTTDETAEVLGISRATVKRDWTYARAWLFERMSGDEED